MLARWALKIWPLILIVSLAIGAFSIPRTIRLYRQISTDPVDLLPNDHPNVQTLTQIRKKVENRTRIPLILESENPDRTISYLKDLASRLKATPFVGKVSLTKPGHHFFDQYKLLFLELGDLQEIRDRIDRRIQKEKLKGFLFDLEGEDEFSFKDLEEKYRVEYSEASRSEYYVSQDGKTFSLYVESLDRDSSLKSASRFYDELEAFVRLEKPSDFEPTLKLYISGPSKVLEYRALLRDLKLAGLISGICIFIPLLIRFRNPFVVFLIFTPLLIGIPVTFTIGSLFISKLSVTTSFLFAILGGLGIENGIHIYSRYHEARKNGLSLEERLREIYGHLAPAILTSVLSVAVTFLLLIVNDFRGFSEFGLIAGIGLGVIFLLYFSFFPALLVLLEKINLLRATKVPGKKDVVGGWLGSGARPRATGEHGWAEPKTGPTRHTWVVLSLFGCFSLYSLLSPFLINFEYDSKKIRADIPEVRIAKEKQRSTLSRVNNPAVLIVQDRNEADQIKSYFKKKKEESANSTIDTTRSYYDLFPIDQPEKMKVIGEMREMLSDPTIRLVKGEQKKDLDRFKEILQEAKPFAEKDIPTELKEFFMGNPEPPGTLFFINAQPKLELDDGRNAMRFAKEIRTIETSTGLRHPSSDASLFGIVLETMFKDIPRVLILSLLSVFAFVMLDFRSFRKSLLVISSILMGVFWLMGVMNIFDIRFNFYNMIIIPSVMGMSIDNAIHLMHRYDEMGKGSLKKVISTTGLTCLLASLTNAGGFAGLLFSIHKGLYSIGLLAVIGVGTCLLSTLVFLPLILKLREIKSPLRL
ncbi:MAG: MMPL family transporter [Deltaproteobacteria bacterium]|nr:MMPL family transporter [Deltaproteobacteria bacterium]